MIFLNPARARSTPLAPAPSNSTWTCPTGIEPRGLFQAGSSALTAPSQPSFAKRAEFSLRAHFTKDISDDFKVKVNFQKTQSNTVDDYWTGNASIERRF